MDMIVEMLLFGEKRGGCTTVPAAGVFEVKLLWGTRYQYSYGTEVTCSLVPYLVPAPVGIEDRV